MPTPMYPPKGTAIASGIIIHLVTQAGGYRVRHLQDLKEAAFARAKSA